MDAEVKIYRGRRGLSELGELWRGLVDRMEHRRFIHTWEWHCSFLEAQEPEPDRSLFVVVSAGDSPLAILPLRPVRRLSGVGRRGLEVPTNPHVPFSDIVVDDPVRLRAAMPAVLTRLVEESSVPWDYLAIRRTLGDSNAARCLRDVPGFPGWVSESGGVHHISLRSYDELFSSLSSHFRNNLRRARKRAEALGGITYHTARSRQECEVLFPEFLEVEASGWKGEAGRKSAIALDGGLRRFYTSLMHSFADREQCRIDVVRHDGRPIAAAFQLVMDHTVYDLKIGFDESYARIAPGSLLHWYIFRTACEDPRLETFNMASDAAWSRQWRPSTAELLDIVVIRPGIAGRVAGTEQRVICQALDWRRRFVRRWIVSERGRRRVAWPRRGPA